MSILDCVDVNVSSHPSGYLIDMEDLSRKNKLRVEVFPQWKLVGWYSFDSVVHATHLAIHKEVSQQCEKPADAVFLMFGESVPSATAESIPLIVYSQQAISVEGSAFMEVKYQISSSDVENIALETLINAGSGGQESAFDNHLDKTSCSLSILSNKLAAIISTLTQMAETGEEHSEDCKLLRSAYSICQSLQATQSLDMERNISAHLQIDSLLSTLSCITKSGNSLRQSGEAHGMLYADRGFMK